MTSRLEVVLLGAQIHLDADRQEVGTATFRRADEPDASHPFHVDATPDQAMQLMKSSGTAFAIVIEEVRPPPAPGHWAYKLVSAAALAISFGEDPATRLDPLRPG